MNNKKKLSSPQSVERSFFRYVSQNILGMIGMSAYVLADTFFISQYAGADGITALNLVLPVYSLIFAIGSMIAVGSATQFKIGRARADNRTDDYFANAIMFAVVFGLVFLIVGIAAPGKVLTLLGGDASIVVVGKRYTRIFLLFAPFFMCNYIFNAFVRNDGAPSLAMAATLFSSLFNIVMDYILIFPMGLGMAGAALATAFSPVVGILICCIHFFSPGNTVRFRLQVPSVPMLLRSCQLGVSALIGEMASGVTTMIFNVLILGLASNTGVAAYGIIANTSLVAVSIFNGISQGSQPLFSDRYGRNEPDAVRKLLRMAVVSSFGVAVLVLILALVLAVPLINVFNSEGNGELASYAIVGVRLYFTGFLFAGVNIVGAGYLSATETPGWAFAVSIMRGVVAISLCAVILSRLFGLTGIWLAFPAAEGLTAVLTGLAVVRNRGKKSIQYRKTGAKPEG